jgi:hypothetical protein
MVNKKLRRKETGRSPALMGAFRITPQSVRPLGRNAAGCSLAFELDPQRMLYRCIPVLLT